MSGQSQIFEGAASLEKHALATVLDFIKKRNLKVSLAVIVVNVNEIASRLVVSVVR